MVAGGQLRAGDELPSVRGVAQDYVINPMTVSKAYSLLEAEGLLARRRGMGMVVADAQATGNIRARLEMLQPYLDAAVLAVRQLEIPSDKALNAFERRLAASSKGDTDETK